jgi:predicted RNase H-like HicB family nuclease
MRRVRFSEPARRSSRRPESKQGDDSMIDLKYSLVVEATEDPSFFGFFSPSLEGFSGIGHSVEDCLYKARFGMEEHVAIMREQGLEVPAPEARPTILVRNEDKLARAS